LDIFWIEAKKDERDYTISELLDLMEQKSTAIPRNVSA